MLKSTPVSALAVGIVASALLLCSCATRPKVYQAPDPARLNASTTREHRAVESAHSAARAAQGSAIEIQKRQKEIATEIKQLKDVPAPLLQKVNDQDQTIVQLLTHQTELETHLIEAEQAKEQVERDKAEYLTGARNLADHATQERNDRITAEKALSWYRWHSWLMKIATALGILGIIVLAFLWFTGRLAPLASKFL